jgi:hypothetical protein
VRGGAVRLDDEPLAAPEEVGGRHAAIGQRDGDVALRPRQRGSAAEREEALLELAARERGAGGMAGEDARTVPAPRRLWSRSMTVWSETASRRRSISA